MPALTTDELNARFEAAYNATHGKTIEGDPLISQAVYTPSIRAKWNAAPFMTKLIAIAIISFVLPWTLLIGGVVALAILTAIAGPAP